MLGGATGIDLESVLDDTEAAIASMLLVESPAAGVFALSHDLVRQTLEEMVSAPSSDARAHR